MASIRVDDSLTFHFKTNVQASKYDEWRYYREVLEPQQHAAVDLVAVRKTQQPKDCWLIEAKDFRRIRGVPGDKNVSKLPETVESKARHTFADLPDTASSAVEPGERSHAELALRAERIRIVLHLEPGASSKLFPVMPKPADVQQKSKQLLKDLDPNPLVLSIATTANAGVPWTVTGA
jgi:hypothetical protein